jgi:hypothetical protein
MGIYMSLHAKKQAAARGINGQEVGRVCQTVESEIARSKTDEVRVIVHEYGAVMRSKDGSEGNLIVACCDKESGLVKTVMLRYDWQVAKDKAGVGRSVDYVEATK